MSLGVPINPVRLAQARHAVKTERGRPLSQAKAAARIGVHWVTWANWERGKYPPSYENVQRICAELGVSISDLVDTDNARREQQEAEDASEARPVGIDEFLRGYIRRVLREEMAA